MRVAYANLYKICRVKHRFLWACLGFIWINYGPYSIYFKFKFKDRRNIDWQTREPEKHSNNFQINGCMEHRALMGRAGIIQIPSVKSYKRKAESDRRLYQLTMFS